MKVIGVAGTAKNTGKTTTTMALIETAGEKSIPLAVTSIGLDGEEFDQVTGLPKPRLKLPEGAYIITAERCISGGTARLETVKELKAQTPLGKLHLARVKKEGRVLMAGPNNRRDLDEVTQSLEDSGAEILIVDGALNRMAPLAGTDLFILATGAARTSNLATLRRETRTLVKVLNLPQMVPGEKTNRSYMISETGTVFLETDSLLSGEKVKKVFNGKSGVKEINIKGVLTGEAFAELGKIVSPEGCRIVLSNPINLLLGENLQELNKAVDNWLKSGGKLGVEFGLSLQAITINPFFPDWQERGRFYQPRFVEEKDLKNSFRSLGVPVINVVREGGNRLWGAVFSEK